MADYQLGVSCPLRINLGISPINIVSLNRGQNKIKESTFLLPSLTTIFGAVLEYSHYHKSRIQQDTQPHN